MEQSIPVSEIQEPLPPDHEARLQRAYLSLLGLSLGDALGERFLFPGAAIMLKKRQLPAGTWHYTDDTAMALSVYHTLQVHGRIDQDNLARRFAAEYAANPFRGYGSMAHRILAAIGQGVPWQEASSAAFHGQGSMGNGSAMRIAPAGAYHAGDLRQAAADAAAAAEITHFHPEGRAGAVATAVAAAMAWQLRADTSPAAPRCLLEAVIDHTPPGETRDGIIAACGLPSGTGVDEAVKTLGNGSRVTAPDTVPFSLWCVSRKLHNYPEAIWLTASGLGDADTTCAIVGSIVALAVGSKGLPADWLARREPLPLSPP